MGQFSRIDGEGLVAARLQEFEVFWKDLQHGFAGFEVVMENDDGARSRVGDDLIEAFFGVDIRVIIAADDIPHNEVIARFECRRLRPADASVRRSEQSAFHDLITLNHLSEVLFNGSFPAVRVIPRMVSDGMEALFYVGQNGRMEGRVFPEAEEGSACVIAVEDVEDFRRHLRDGAIIKSDEDLLFGRVDLPDELFGQRTNDGWNAVDEHISVKLRNGGQSADGGGIRIILLEQLMDGFHG